MKVAILSDIHGNIDALQAVLQDLPSDIAELWILGDLIGYYYRSKEVLNALRAFPCKYIAGNHEHYLRDGLKNPAVLKDYKAKYGSSLELTIKNLSSAEMEFLHTLPDSLKFQVGSKNILLCHGSPWDNDEYIYPDVKAEKLTEFESVEADFIFLGHTHYPMELDIGTKKVINPGSVGQPRNRKPGAHWVIFDLETEKLTFKITPYPIDSLLKEIAVNDPGNTYLKTVLTRT
jgi:putative phosphoesterase